MRSLSLSVAAAAMLASSSLAAAQDAARGDAARGAAEFERACSACHTIADGARRRVGPNLFGVVGGRIASKGDYPYSEAFRRSDIVWDEETLADFLEAPGRTVPGTKMDWAVPERRTVADIIAFMSGFRR